MRSYDAVTGIPSPNLRWPPPTLNLGSGVPGNIGLVAIEDVHIEASGATIC
jgi:hypothetical protein